MHQNDGHNRQPAQSIYHLNARITTNTLFHYRTSNKAARKRLLPDKIGLLGRKDKKDNSYIRPIKPQKAVRFLYISTSLLIYEHPTSQRFGICFLYIRDLFTLHVHFFFAPCLVYFCKIG